ncbi:hypothetical protein [Pseudoduganella ginsengisoli]|uniref:Uncharacterized protein n=1 Tax=Pseudoduganella ginsengisoli TaxID=1462440 RepID=A0A6L6Q2P0_9BURK|nr:hypothetical protein [Pseudoduganella ginsengisoli]MTW04143.1 hypothetical protein [Pseudoduganella ginsengisoli]
MIRQKSGMKLGGKWVFCLESRTSRWGKTAGLFTWNGRLMIAESGADQGREITDACFTVTALAFRILKATFGRGGPNKIAFERCKRLDQSTRYLAAYREFEADIALTNRAGAINKDLDE